MTQTGSGKLQHYTTELNEKTLYITGAAGSSIDLTDEKASGLNKYTTLGFHLAGVDIPHPTKHTVHKSGAATNTGASLPNTGCNLEWVKRTAEVTENSKTVNKEVYVLAFTGCTASGGSETDPNDNCEWEPTEGAFAHTWEELSSNYPGYELLSTRPEIGGSCSGKTWACVKIGNATSPYAGVFNCYHCSCATSGGGSSSTSTCTNEIEKETCESCGGTWNSTRCRCDCGVYQGNSCTWTGSRCKCGTLERACR